MEKGKKPRILVVAAILMIVCAVAAFLLTPAVPVRDASKVSVTYVYKVTDGGFTDITAKADKEAIIGALPLMRCRRLPSGQTVTYLNETWYELRLSVNGKPLTVVLGTDGKSYVYSSSKRMRKLLNADSWTALIRGLTN